MGLSKNARASPYVQELSALLTSKMPCEQAVRVAERMGLDLSRCFLHREAHRQGLKAQAARAEHLAQIQTWEGIQQVATQTPSRVAEPFTLILEIDAWNIRERDSWGLTEELRAQGQAVSRWHWVYVGTVFRLDHRGQTSTGRALISRRAYALTCLGIEELSSQLHREAVACGLGEAKEVLIIADGALWIWNIAKDRFPMARQRLDLYHAEEHLWAVAHELHGKGTPEARAWVEPLLKRLRHDESPAVIASLKEIQPTLSEGLQKKVQTEMDYFAHNENRLKYREIVVARQAVEEGKATAAQEAKAREPLGSGAIKSTCRQYQCRFKRTGQFWTQTGDEALMCLETFWRNDRWHLLYPHSKPTSPALN